MGTAKKRVQKILCYLLPILSLAVCGLLVFYLCLPALLRTTLLPIVIRESGLDTIAFDIRRLGLTSTEIGPVRIGGGDLAAIEIRSVRIEYSPATLRHKRVSAVVIDGMTIRCSIRDGRLEMPGLDLQKLMGGERQPDTERAPAAGVSLPALPLDRFLLQDGLAALTLEGVPVAIPFELHVKPSGEGSRIEAILDGLLRQQRLAISMLADAGDNTVRVMAAAEGVRPDRFADLLPAGVKAHLEGTASLESTTLLSLNPPALVSSRTRIAWHDPAAVIFANGRAIRLTAPVPGEAVAIELTAEEGGGRWQLSGPSLAVVAGPLLALSGLELNARILDGEVDVAGTAQLVIDPAGGDSGIPFSMEAPLVLPLSLSASGGRAGAWQVEVSSADPGEAADPGITATAGSVEATAGPPRIAATVKGNGDRVDARWEAALPALRLITPEATVRIPELVVGGTALVIPSEKGPSFTAGLRSTLLNVQVLAGERTLRLPSVVLAGHVQQNGVAPLQMESELTIVGGTFRDPDAGLVVSGIGGRFPWQPGLTGEATRKGRFRVAAIRLGERDLGAVTVETRQHGDAVRFSGRHTSRFLKGLVATFSGSLAPLDDGGPSASVAFQVPTYTPRSSLALGPYAAALKGASATGTVSVGGRADFTDGVATAAAEIELHNGNIEWPDRNLSVKGIQTTVTMAELPTVRTLPGQRIQFESADIGTIRIDGGSVDFQLESPNSFLIEKGVVSWCDGRMGTQALRIVPGVSTYDTTLYCDRLNLTRVLEQLGGIRGEGSGTVNGRIPLLIKEGRFTFHNGFLYSTPGEGGRIRITGTESLTAGMPVDLARSGYLDLAREALKDYEYRWVTLHIGSEKDDLLMMLKFDGKPAGTLPFVYKEELGGFARVDATNPGSNFQGLSLDVNLRLPLDKILQYRDITDMLHLE